MKSKSIDELTDLCTTQKQKLTAKNRALREKDTQIAHYEKLLEDQQKKLDSKNASKNSLSKRLTKKSEQIELLEKQLREQLAKIQELENSLENLSAEKKSLQEALIDKHKVHVQLNQKIIEANRSALSPVTDPSHTSPIQRLLEGMEDGTVGTHQIPGGVAGALG